MLREETAGPLMVSRGRVHDGRELPGLVAMHDGDRAGVLLHWVEGDELEVVFMATTVLEVGAGVALLVAAVELAALHGDAVDESRKLKPTIPETGSDGIPIRHELELERRL